VFLDCLSMGCVSGLSINGLCFWIVCQLAVFLDCLSFITSSVFSIRYFDLSYYYIMFY
jgi:hypothetical protein